jgi:hypothetical protein
MFVFTTVHDIASVIEPSKVSSRGFAMTVFADFNRLTAFCVGRATGASCAGQERTSAKVGVVHSVSPVLVLQSAVSSQADG